MNKVIVHFGEATKELIFNDRKSAIVFINKIPKLLKKKSIHHFWDNDNKGFFIDMSKVLFIDYDLEVI